MSKPPGKARKMNIRILAADDLPSVNRLIQQLAAATGTDVSIRPGQLERIFERMAAHPDLYLNLVAEQAGDVVGMISVVCYQTWFHPGGTALINELIVDEQARNQGIGKQLIDAAIEEAHKRGMDELEVGTKGDNLGAQRFYRRCGFDHSYVLLGMEFEP